MAVHFLYETQKQLGGFESLYRHRFIVTEKRVTVETYDGHCLVKTNYFSVREGRKRWKQLAAKGATQTKPEKPSHLKWAEAAQDAKRFNG